MSPYSHRRILAIALPMILSNVSVPLLGMVDTAVVGHLDSPHYLAAVAVGSAVFGFLYTSFNFLRMGTTGLAAQAAGAADDARLRTVLAQGLASALLLGILLIALQRPAGAVAFRLIGAQGAVLGEAWTYFGTRIWSAPATLGLYALSGWLIGLQRTRAALAIVLVQNVANIALDLLFVPVLGWKVAGVAAATVIADYLALAFGVRIAWRAMGGAREGWSLAAVRERASLQRLFALNGHLLVRTMVLTGAFAFMTAMGARQGELVLAANALLIQMLYLLAYALDGFANAAEALVGRALGARDAAGVRLAVRRCMAWTAGVAAGIAAACALGGPALLALLTSLPGVLRTAIEYLPWLVAAPLVCAWAYAWDGIFVGATLSRQMRDTMLAAAAVFVVAWWALRPLGNHGLWAAFLLFNGARGIAQRWTWRRATGAAGAGGILPG